MTYSITFIDFNLLFLSFLILREYSVPLPFTSSPCSYSQSIAVDTYMYANVFRVSALLPFGHLKAKGWSLGSSLWCLLWFCYFPFWYPGTSVVLDCIDSWSLLSFYFNAWSVTSHINCIVARWRDKRWLSHSMCLYQVMMTLYYWMTSPITANRHTNR